MLLSSALMCATQVEVSVLYQKDALKHSSQETIV